MYLDPQIRNWVFLPLMMIMILIGLLRSIVLKLINSKPKVDLLTIRESSALMKLRLLKQFHSLLPLQGFESRRLYWIQAVVEKRYLKVKEPTQPSFDDPQMMNPMMQMMTKNMIMFIPQTIIMSWVSFVFTGFVLTRLPFPLTVRFKSMLQSGIDTQDMDVKWVSSLSWYFLLLFGLTSVYTLLGDSDASGAGMDMMQMQMQQQNPMQQPAEVIKVFNNEKEYLELCNWEQEDLLDCVLEKYGTRSTGNKKLD
jgi:ER membrane protein complex subunit 3